MKIIVFALFTLLALTTVGCKKYPGCMDENAENYNWEAEEDDGTCSYRGSAVFYHGELTSGNLLADGVTNVRLFVDGTFWDAMSPNVYFDFVPECGHPDAMNMGNYGIGNAPSKTFNYAIKDQDDVVLAAGTFMIEGNTCNRIVYYY